MRQPGACTKCGGTEVRKYVLGPEAALFTGGLAGRFKSWVMAYTCEACGFIELYAEGTGFLPPKS